MSIKKDTSHIRPLTIRLDLRDDNEKAIVDKYDKALSGRKHDLLRSYLVSGFKLDKGLLSRPQQPVRSIFPEGIGESGQEKKIESIEAKEASNSDGEELAKQEIEDVVTKDSPATVTDGLELAVPNRIEERKVKPEVIGTNNEALNFGGFFGNQEDSDFD